MMARKKPAPKPASGSMEDLRAALEEADADHQRRTKQGGKKDGPDWRAVLPEVLKWAGSLTVVALLILIGDGLRREAGETTAGLAELSGPVTVQKGGVGALLPATKSTSLARQDVLRTGPDGSATLVFADGSALRMAPGSELEIRMLDFARGKVRDRSFMVRSGQVVARMSGVSGEKSQATVCTPTTITSAQGAGLSVYYDPAKRKTYVGVVEGTAQFRTCAAQTSVPAGQAIAAGGYRIGAPGVLGPQQRERIRTTVNSLAKHDRGPGPLEGVEYSLNAALDPALQLIGLAPGGWSYAAGNAARRAAALEALKRLQQHMVSLQDEQIPDAISLTTMDELGVDPEQKPRMLDTFAGGMLESYRKTGTGAYEILVRSRDRDKTQYVLTPQGTTQVKAR